MILVLFDIDGTLISTQGAGMRAFYRAFENVLNIPVTNSLIRPDGMTDPLILKELMTHFDLQNRWCEETQNELFSSYLHFLDEEMSLARENAAIRVLPGVKKLLEMLEDCPEFYVGLATGNLEQGARIKLKYAELDQYFQFGGFGSDSDDRTIMTRLGIQRGTKAVAPEPVVGVFVIGDTPLDVYHGHAAGAHVIAVASARFSMDALRSHNPDLVVQDLTSGKDIIRFMQDEAR